LWDQNSAIASGQAQENEMSHHLERAALLDPQRAADLAANDVAMEMEPRHMQVFGIHVKAGTSVRLAFECMARSSMEALMQHADLKGEGEYIVVRAVEAA
jgi:hypothetical protein